MFDYAGIRRLHMLPAAYRCSQDQYMRTHGLSLLDTGKWLVWCMVVVRLDSVPREAC